MKKLKLDLTYCYGIKQMHEEFDFSKQNAIAVYAPNGSMKTSLAQTFLDLSQALPSKDRYFPTRTTVRKITDETATDLDRTKVFVLKPYDADFSHTEKTSTLLVNNELRKEYEQLHADINKSKVEFLNGLKELSGSKKDLEKEISSAFTKSNDEFFKALLRIREEMAQQKDELFSDIAYDRVFDEKVLAFLGTKDVNAAIKEYIEKYNELLTKSTYFKKGVFNYHNAATIAKNLADNGFFEAKHFVTLNADTKREIRDEADLKKVIEEEKKAILTDKELKKRFDEIEKKINRNENLREFNEYLSKNDKLLPHLANLDAFKEEIWKSYFKTKIDTYNTLVESYLKVEKRKAEIEEEARKQRTQWENVIDIFNERFYVPFTLEAKNRVAVILAQEPLLTLSFKFNDGEDTAPVEKSDLLMGLSTGEKKALYVLNIIFEVERRRQLQEETLFIIDDIADSFDYKNKYAIIEYLKDISTTPYFYQVILTHNFDFFRTINSRYIKYSQCFMAYKARGVTTLQQAEGIKNVFINDWKPNFFKDSKKRIAAIPFIRNMIEYTKGEGDPNYLKLTSLLHWKADSKDITNGDLAKIYNETFGGSAMPSDKDKKVMDTLVELTEGCMKAADGVNFENKIVLSIAIRLKVEQFMIQKIANPPLTSSLSVNQTSQLFELFKARFPKEINTLKVIERVLLMTPENIHLNSFMYEPILDMSDGHLKKLCEEVNTLR